MKLKYFRKLKRSIKPDRTGYGFYDQFSSNHRKLYDASKRSFSKGHFLSTRKKENKIKWNFHCQCQELLNVNKKKFYFLSNFLQNVEKFLLMNLQTHQEFSQNFSSCFLEATKMAKETAAWTLINTRCCAKMFSRKSEKEKKAQKMSLEKSVGKAFKYLAVLHERENINGGENEKCLKLILWDIPGSFIVDECDFSRAFNIRNVSVNIFSRKKKDKKKTENQICGSCSGLYVGGSRNRLKILRLSLFHNWGNARRNSWFSAQDLSSTVNF